MASSDQSVTTDGDATRGHAVVCPLCSETASERDIYRHLMVNHRKSELSRLVVSTADTTAATKSSEARPETESEMVSESSLD